MRDIHAEVTAALVTAIEADPGTPEMPWHRGGAGEMPRNIASGKEYRGINILNLWLGGQAAGLTSPLWGTRRQWEEAGYTIERGARSSPVVFYMEVAKDGTSSRVVDTRPTINKADECFYRFLKHSEVYNAEQVIGYRCVEPALGPPLPRLDHIDETVAATGATIREGGVRACYVPSLDRIEMPDGHRFRDTESGSRTENFYAVLMHELTHWTGHDQRLARDLTGRFGSEAYAMEELVAEIGAAFLCARLRIAPVPRPDHAKYLASWLRVLKADTNAIFIAAAQAQKAADYIL